MTFFRCLCLLFILCCCNSKPKTDAGMIRVSVLRGPSAICLCTLDERNARYRRQAAFRSDNRFS